MPPLRNQVSDQYLNDVLAWVLMTSSNRAGNHPTYIVSGISVNLS